MSTLATEPDETLPKEAIAVIFWDNGNQVRVQIDPDKDLVGLTEIADVLGVSRQRAAQLSKRDDFPPAIGTTKAGTFWLRQQVVTYDINRKPRVDRYMGTPKRQAKQRLRHATSAPTAKPKQQLG